MDAIAELRPLTLEFGDWQRLPRISRCLLRPLDAGLRPLDAGWLRPADLLSVSNEFRKWSLVKDPLIRAGNSETE